MWGMDAGAALLTGPGQELLARLAGMDVGPDRVFAVSEALRAEYPAELVAAALTQQALRVAGRAKFGAADQMLFTRAGLEQASSELTARHAAARFAGVRVVIDLCCGIGGNLAALARAADGAAVIGVDRDLVSLEFARHNVAATAPAKRVGFVCADVRELPLAEGRGRVHRPGSAGRAGSIARREVPAGAGLVPWARRDRAVGGDQGGARAGSRPSA